MHEAPAVPRAVAYVTAIILSNMSYTPYYIAELGELSILWVIATRLVIDLVGRGSGIPMELWWNCGLRNWNFIFTSDMALWMYSVTRDETDVQ